MDFASESGKSSERHAWKWIKWRKISCCRQWIFWRQQSVAQIRRSHSTSPSLYSACYASRRSLSDHVMSPVDNWSSELRIKVIHSWILLSPVISFFPTINLLSLGILRKRISSHDSQHMWDSLRVPHVMHFSDVALSYSSQLIHSFISCRLNRWNLLKIYWDISCLSSRRSSSIRNSFCCIRCLGPMKLFQRLLILNHPSKRQKTKNKSSQSYSVKKIGKQLIKLLLSLINMSLFLLQSFEEREISRSHRSVVKVRSMKPTS